MAFSRNEQHRLFTKGLKHCSVCNEIKSLNDFGKIIRSKDGYRGQCKKCKNKNQVLYQKKNREKINNYNKLYMRNYLTQHRKFVEIVRKIFNKPDGDLEELLERLKLARNMEIIHGGCEEYFDLNQIERNYTNLTITGNLI